MGKDLNYYLQHPDEMPTDPAELEKLTEETRLAAMQAGEEELTVDRFVPPEGKDDSKGDSSAAEAKVEETKPEAEEVKAEEVKTEVAEPEKDEKQKGILAKDGKNVIPYAVLATARERAEAAERLVKEQAAELEKLKNGAVVTETTETLSDEELDALAEDSPTLAKILRAQQETIQSLTGTVQSLVQNGEVQAEAEAAAVKSEIQEAIDSNPTLSAWQADEDQTAWNQAAAFDKVLRESPAFRDKSFAERFEKVVEMTNSTLGLVEAKPAVEVKEVKEGTPVPTQAEIKAAAAAKLAEKSAKNIPVSLSQIPGGAPPAVDERDRVEAMSPVELGNKFLGMKSQEDIEAFLAQL